MIPKALSPGGRHLRVGGGASGNTGGATGWTGLHFWHLPLPLPRYPGHQPSRVMVSGLGASLQGTRSCRLGACARWGKHALSCPQWTALVGLTPPPLGS